MTRPRSELISLSDTPWYHLVNRCVRRAFLCGQDHKTGEDFSHRKSWIEGRIRQLAGVFAIDVAAYAVMSNHYHVVVRVDRVRAEAWTTDEVLAQWTRIFTGPLLVQRYINGDTLSPAELSAVSTLAEQYRRRLYDISWFMRVLNESIARMANGEDGVKGHFWEGRFKSQALLDEQAILAVMSYVDLNPIRAGLAETPEASEYTSIQARLEQRDNEQQAPVSLRERHAASKGAQAIDDEVLNAPATIDQLPQAALLPFDPSGQTARAVAFAYADYLEWVDYIGRAVHPGKKGHIPAKLPALAVRLNIDPHIFAERAQHLLNKFSYAVGGYERMQSLSLARGSHHLRGMGEARQIFRVA